MRDVDPLPALSSSPSWQTLAVEDAALSTYLRAVRAHWVVVLAVIALSLGTAAIGTSVRPPTYEAAARVLVAPVSAGDGTFVGVQVVRESPGDPTRSMQTAAALLSSGPAAQATSRALGGRLDATEVAEAVTVEPVGESNILAVRARASTPQEAATIASTYASSALALRSDTVRTQIAKMLVALEEQHRALVAASANTAAEGLAARIVQLRTTQAQGDPSLSLEQEASPGSQEGASRALILTLAAIAGVAIGATGAILLELAGRRVRDTDEASVLFPLPVLARVPRISLRRRQAMMNGSVRLDAAAQEEFQRLYRELAQGSSSQCAIMLTSASSGDGKTTAAVYLATTMALAGRRVVLFDCDLRNSRAARLLGVEGIEHSRKDPVAGVGELLVPVPGLPLSLLSFAQRDAVLGASDALIDRLPDLLAEVRPLADFIVIDTAPLGEVSDALPLLKVVDHVVVVARPGHTDRGSFEAMRDLLRRMRAPVSGLLMIGDRRVHGRLYPRRAGGGARVEWAAGARLEDGAPRSVHTRASGKTSGHAVRHRRAR